MAPARLPLVILMLCLMLCALTAGCGDVGRNDTAGRTNDDRERGYSATGTELVQTGADGLPRYRLRAGNIEQDPRSLEVTLQDIRLETRERDGGPWQVDAPAGRLSGDARRLDLTGGVSVIGDADGATGPLQLLTSRLQYDLVTARMRAPGEVKVTMQGHELVGTGLDANLRTGQVRLQADIRGRFAP